MNWTSDMLIAAALRKEIRGLKRCLNQDLRFAVTGLGTDRTLERLQAMFDQWQPSLLIFAGLAGQLDPALTMGEVVVPAAWELEAGTRFEIDRSLLDALAPSGVTVGGLGLTVHVPVVGAASRQRVFEKTGARICDMETAAALMVARSYRVPCLAAKVVSDTAKTGMMGFYRQFDRNVKRLGEGIAEIVAVLE